MRGDRGLADDQGFGDLSIRKPTRDQPVKVSAVAQDGRKTLAAIDAEMKAKLAAQRDRLAAARETVLRGGTTPKDTDDLLEEWVADLDSWDIVDGCAQNYFRKLPRAHEWARKWTARPEEYGKRAGFATIAKLAVHDKVSPDAVL